MITIESDRYLYEVELGVYSYFEDKFTHEYFYLDHKSRTATDDPMVKELIRTKIGIIELILEQTEKNGHWSNLLEKKEPSRIIKLISA